MKKIYLTQTTDFSIGSSSTCPVAGGILNANASCILLVTFNPQTIGSKKSTLVVMSSDPASPLLAQATGVGTEVKVSASALSFGTISYGTNSILNLTISNTGTATFTLAPTITGAGFLLAATGKTCGSSIAAGGSCVLPVEFNPTAVGSSTGIINLATNGGSSPTISLLGTATTDVSATPASLTFGTVKHATTKVLNVMVSNVGKLASLSVSPSISGSGAKAFTVLSAGNTCTTGVAPGKSCTLPLQFDPAAVASYAATLTITTNGGANPAVALSGAGD